MPDKILTQRAQGYGNQPVTVTAQINGVIVLQGAIPTQDTPPPALPDFWTPELGVNAWSWTVDEHFQGAQTMTVSVDNGQMYLCDTFCSYSNLPDVLLPLISEQQIGNVLFLDPLSSVTINGIAQNPVRDSTHNGQWVWRLVAGDEFACTVNTLAPPPPAPPTPPPTPA